MTSSKSSNWIARAIVVLVALVLGSGVASADRKRLVVMEFEGDEAEAIQKSFVKFLKKSHTVVTADKWNTAADELGATKVNEKNVKKVAKKLKVDGVITGNVEKRRDEYIIRIKLRAGSSGSLVGSQINAKSDATKLSKQAKTDIEDELFGSIDTLESVRGGGDEEEEKPAKEEEEEEKPSKFGGKQMKEEAAEETQPAKLTKKELEAKKKEEELAKKEEAQRKKDEEKKAKDDEKKRKDEETKAALATKRDKQEVKEDKEEETEEEESPLPKPKKGKKTAKRDLEEEEGIEEEAEPTGRMSRKVALSPGNRAVDAVVGVSMNMRRMSFSYDPTIGQRPAGYKGKMVPGGFFDMAVYPLALGHKRTDILKNIGFTFMYDQVLLVKSQDAAGKELKSAQVRYAFGAQFRYPFGRGAGAPVIGARVRYGSQAFKIAQPAPLPSVTYTMLEPGLFFRMPLLSNKLTIDANVAFLAVTNTGQIQDQMKYGGATVTGFEVNLGADYHLSDALFMRGIINYETISYSFKKNGMLPTATDNLKVTGAKDNYYGLVISAGYLF
ncbi:MAG: hypothetical protein H0T65_08335 [Deltaproteobacteria bacterium]|nr:hypothetical protein [Deltaproteobacteria bacterium]